MQIIEIPQLDIGSRSFGIMEPMLIKPAILRKSP